MSESRAALVLKEEYKEAIKIKMAAEFELHFVYWKPRGMAPCMFRLDLSHFAIETHPIQPIPQSELKLGLKKRRLTNSRLSAAG